MKTLLHKIRDCAVMALESFKKGYYDDLKMFLRRIIDMTTKD